MANPFHYNRSQKQSEDEDRQLFTDEPEALEVSDKHREILGFLGKTGSGKSFKMKQMIQQYKDYDRVIIYDTMNEYRYNDPDFGKIWQDYTIITELEDFVETVFGGINSEKLKIIYWALDDELEAEAFCATVYSLGRCLVAMEEIDSLAPQRFKVPRSVLELFKRGRHRAISIYWTTQRPAEVSKTIVGLTDKIYAFKITETNDIKYLKYVSPKAEELPNLGQYEYLELP